MLQFRCNYIKGSHCNEEALSRAKGKEERVKGLYVCYLSSHPTSFQRDVLQNVSLKGKKPQEVA